MKRFIEGVDRTQTTLLPESLEDYVAEDNPVRVVEAFFEELDLRTLGFRSIDPAVTGRPAYHPSVHVRTEMSLHVLAYNLKRLINMLGVKGAVAAIRA